VFDRFVENTIGKQMSFSKFKTSQFGKEDIYMNNAFLATFSPMQNEQ